MATNLTIGKCCKFKTFESTNKFFYYIAELSTNDQFNTQHKVLYLVYHKSASTSLSHFKCKARLEQVPNIQEDREEEFRSWKIPCDALSM